ncbi:MAG: cupin domain-containing protein [Deltaproteobacteria bacterium]|nr:cupin domain-containing protein [Deltaproteobacteria bacterium]
MEIIRVSEKVGFSDAFMPRILKVSPDYKVPLICLKAGQLIPPHASGTGIFYILSGAGIMTVDDEKKEITAGDMIVVEKGATRGIEATEDLTAFAVHMG